jgi:hypothetical protein
VPKHSTISPSAVGAVAWLAKLKLELPAQRVIPPPPAIKLNGRQGRVPIRSVHDARLRKNNYTHFCLKQKLTNVLVHTYDVTRRGYPMANGQAISVWKHWRRLSESYSLCVWAAISGPYRPTTWRKKLKDNRHHK